MDVKYTLLLQFTTEETVQLAYSWLIDTQIVENTTLSQDLKGTNTNTQIQDLKGERNWRLNKYSILRMQTDNYSDKKIDSDISIISQYLGNGIIHLFRESEIDQNTSNVKESFSSSSSSSPPTTTAKDENNLQIIPGDSTMVSILFVPTYFTVHDLLHFYIGDDIVQNQISNFRILKNLNNNIGFNFMVLIKFKKIEDAKCFKDKFNGKSFTKMDPEKCHVVFIDKILLQKNLFINKKLPYLLTDPFTSQIKNKDNLPNSNNQIELPTCPVCLERLDSDITGLITIPCQHTFHCHCLDRWKNSNCPVCRFSSFRISRDNLINKPSHKCYNCQESNYKNLWICLICGNIGCSRYSSKHAITHYESTQHCFAMDLKTQRVWDYAGDNYVHRIVQNEIDGKLVEVSVQSNNSTNNNNNVDSNNTNNNNNDDNSRTHNDKSGYNINNKEYHLEYVQLLISQLESQREYYELKINQITELKSDKDDKINQLQHDNDKIKELIEIKSREIDENKLMIKGMLQNLEKLQKRNETLEQQSTILQNEKIELEQQVKDLMFYLDTQSKFQDATEDEKNGQIITVGGTNNQTTDKKKKKKKKKINKIPGR